MARVKQKHGAKPKKKSNALLLGTVQSVGKQKQDLGKRGEEFIKGDEEQTEINADPNRNDPLEKKAVVHDPAPPLLNPQKFYKFILSRNKAETDQQKNANEEKNQLHTPVIEWKDTGQKYLH